MWRVSSRAPAVLDRIEAIRQAEGPLLHPSNATGFPSFRAIQADVLKGMISYRIGFLECEHRRASNGQHARKGWFNDSFPACQALNSRQLTDGYFRQIWREIADSAALHLIAHRFTHKKPPHID